MRAIAQKKEIQKRKVPAPPKGKAVLPWLAPGLLWMVSAVGSGSLLFTPRIAARYEYELLWLVPLVALLMWSMIREAGRYTTYTGKTLLEGAQELPGPKNWAVWTIFLPQLAAAAVGVAGLSFLTGATFHYLFPLNPKVYSIAFVIISCWLVVSGQYSLVEKFGRYLAMILLAGVLLASAKVFQNPEKFARGLAPSFPAEPDYPFILPWIGTILAGSMGIVWFSYWAGVRGYGGGVAGMKEGSEQNSVKRKQKRRIESSSEGGARISKDKEKKLKSWFKILDATAALGVLGGLFVIIGFLILGTGLLAPKNIIPQGMGVFEDLARLMGDLWGNVGVWLMAILAINAFGGSVVANQDGWGRSFSDMTLILSRKAKGRRETESGQEGTKTGILEKLSKVLPGNIDLTDRKELKDFYALLVTGAAPIAIILLFDDPVRVMSASGLIAAIHTPFIGVIILACSGKLLPNMFRPHPLSLALLTAACLFYFFFGVLYLLNG